MRCQQVHLGPRPAVSEGRRCWRLSRHRVLHMLCVLHFHNSARITIYARSVLVLLSTRFRSNVREETISYLSLER